MGISQLHWQRGRKHVTIKRPNNSGSNYWCYLHKYSIVLMAIVGPDYKFICVDIGGFGKNSDGGIFETSNMGKRFEQNCVSLHLDFSLGKMKSARTS
ncbi:unnamed protein product [Acanthoscelides obtectus]|uniref:DDE Tnp4 domain-containing protein n=1 Tax=Acanthoscelides obtectus TaxID=200917 RepID=A0A9P0PIY9_ACAOB|nr:unnamed protein product [Acanthoscelides obtectus]CAK1639390.1 hypothetical protein AOBTE_LOCUS11160 [Acanthoscelides obtectus]